MSALYLFGHQLWQFGSAIHSALEWYHKRELMNRKAAQNQIWCIFAADWFAQKYDNIRFKKTETEEKLMELADKMIKTYVNSPVPKKTEAVELEFSVALIDPGTSNTLNIPLVGRFDRIEKGNTIIDIKTAKQKMSQIDADSNLQLTAYAYAYWKNYDIIPNLRFDIITKTQNPALVRVNIKRSIKHFRILYLQAKYVLDGIVNKLFFANPSWRCIDCEYRSGCWFWNGEVLPLAKAA